MKYEAICTLSSEFSVRKMCKALELRQSGYYAWLKRRGRNLKKLTGEQELVEVIRQVFNDNRQVYGYRKMQRALVKKGIEISVYRLRKLMRSNGLYAITMTKYKPAHNGKKDGRFFKDSVGQNFRADTPNRVWMGDITYIKTRLGWTYLAVVMDMFNREIIGYSVSKNIDTELTKQALSNAIGRAGGKTKGLIFHSDRGCQYSSKAYQNMLIENNIEGSMGRPSYPFDNACAESFFGTAKKECIYRKQYETMDEVKRDLFAYIELFYNRQRMHATLGYMSPVDYRISREAR